MKRLLYLFSASENLLTDLSPKLHKDGIDSFLELHMEKIKFLKDLILKRLSLSQI